MTSGNVVISNGTTVIKDSGFTIGKSVPSDAEFTDTKVIQTEQSSTTTTYPVLFSAQSSPTSGTAYDAKYATACYLKSNHLYSNSKQVVNLSDTQALTNKTYNGYTLADACAKAVDTSISAGSTSTNLPTSAAVATFVEGKGYVTSSGVTSVATGVGLTGGTITSTGTIKVKLKNGDTASSLASATTSTTASRQYAVEPDSSGYLSVNVPWTNINSDYAPKASPALTGTPTAPTATAGTNTTQIATTAFVQTAIAELPQAMIFRGTLGTGGTITSLPTAGSTYEGDVYKVITAGTYASQSAKVGDTFICGKTGTSTYEWILIPSGDEPSGTVTNVATGVGLTGGPITSSGTIKAKLKSETNATYDSESVTNTQYRQYAVVPDKTNGYLSVNVPWTDTTYPITVTDVSITEVN